ncbi:hypothetical protein QQF64_004909 [Cirrhinus molitorella]|uniref:Uncharacterized protein n=1 Tax=Cirrhinus molitorella TaxID=172907 RepID=A0ABR3MK59_9TELE
MTSVFQLDYENVLQEVEKELCDGCHGLTVGLHGMTYFAYGVLPDKILNFQLGGISGKSLSSKGSLPFMFPIAGDLSER